MVKVMVMAVVTAGHRVEWRWRGGSFVTCEPRLLLGHRRDLLLEERTAGVKSVGRARGERSWVRPARPGLLLLLPCVDFIVVVVCITDVLL